MNPLELLIVEDEPLVAEDLRDILEQGGHTVVGTAGTAERALELARTSSPALALVDIRLQGAEDGIHLARSLGHLGIGVIFVTAHSDPATLRRASRTDPLGFVTKPFLEAELLRTLFFARRLLEGRRREHLAEERLRSVLDTLDEGLAVLEFDGAAAYQNPTFGRLLSHPNREALLALRRALEENSGSILLHPNLEVTRLSRREHGEMTVVVRKARPTDTTSGYLTMCAHCRRVQGPSGEWTTVENALGARFGLFVSHGICCDCIPIYFGEDEEPSEPRS